MNPQCYKCAGENELSIKRTLKSGHMLFICRPCRREAASLYNQTRIPKPKKQRMSHEPITKAWVSWAKETNSNLAKKYADTTYLEARGML